MASTFEINSDYSHEILDRIKSNLPKPSSSSTSRGNYHFKTFSNSKNKPKVHLKFNDVSLRRIDNSNSKGLTQIKNNNDLPGLLMPKTIRQDLLSSPASLFQQKQENKPLTTKLKSNQFELNIVKAKKTLENTKHSSLRHNLKSYQTETLEAPPRLWLFEKSPSTKQQSSLNNFNDKNIAVIDDVHVLPLNVKSTFFTGIEAVGLVGVIFAAVVLVCWIKKFILRFSNKKRTSSIKSLNIGKKSLNQIEQKKIITVFRQSFILRRPVVISKIMDTNTENDQFSDRSNNDSNKSTPYFTPLGTFDDDRSRFEYPLPPSPKGSCRGSGKLNSNEELLLPISIASASADSVQNLTSKSKTSATPNTANTTNNIISIESPARRFSSERRPCSPAWSYMTHLLTANQVSNKSQYDTYDNLYAAGATPLFSAMSAFSEMHSARPSPPASASAVEGSNLMNRQNCRSPKYDKEGDKENAVPTKTINKQQNSPLPMEVSRLSSTKFSFSPKDISDKSSSSSAADGRCAVKSSPTLSSAGYTKNGDYFKFPEVDLFSPGITNKNAYQFVNKHENEHEMAYPSNNLQHDKLKVLPSVASEAQASRRARLKSISLDSEGAKLVEDNLGVPVEELIEMSTSTVMPSDYIVTSPNTNNKNNISNLKNSSILNSEREQLETGHDADDRCCFDEGAYDGSYVPNSNRSHNLSLKVMWYNDVNQNSHRESIIRTPPPKTPTLGKTKQKAISFDSSDSSKLLSSSSSSSMSRGLQDHEQNDTSNESNVESSPAKAVSLMHISSLSMPGTPKRNFSPNKKYNHVVSRINRSKQKQLNSNITVTPSTPSLLSFDHNIITSKCTERQGFILKLDSFNENSIDDVDYSNVELGAADDDVDGDNYFINFDDSATAAATSNNTKLIHEYEPSTTKKLSPDYLIGSNLQTQKGATALSLSNSNLKTLPEVMTLSDFSVSRQADEVYGDTLKVAPAVAIAVSTGGGKQSNVLSSRAAIRSSLLQRRGSNHSLTLNLNESYGSLNRGLSASNYSLSSNSQYNLSNSIYNLTASKQQALVYKGNSVGIPTTFMHNGSNFINQSGHPGNSSEKKNLLQRRGSNTSLTLNIHGSSYVHLNRFKSHSSLNITSHPTQQQNLFKIQQQQQQHCAVKDSVLNENSSNSKSSSNKKGLLERRGSNASLTINLQCNALAVSNLRGSACSLSSINTNQLEEEYEIRGNQENEFLEADTIAVNSVCVGQQRKFFSSENLNSLNNRSQYTKLNQTHMRNSTKTCFGSVSDLNNYSQLPISLISNKKETILPTTLHINQTKSSNMNSNSDVTLSKTKQVISESFITNFEQSNLCSCTGLRNITTRPLSPQTTSEDFKMYLANVQLLQNASNVLDGYDLMKLNYVFEKSYCDDENLDHSNTLSEGDVYTFDDKNQWKLILSSFFQIDLPDENEQKRLIRSLHQEFWDLPTNHQEKPMVFGSQSKNRYKSILPNEHSRVQLIAEEGCMEDPYINANYIKGPDYVQKSYIATQGPLPNTIYDFWLMIYQNICRYDEQQKYIGSTEPYCSNKNSSKLASSPIQLNKIPDFCSTGATNRQQFKNKRQKIIMLTNFVENNRQKCATYFPINENDIFLITYTNDEIKNNDIKIFYNEYFKKHETSSSNYDTFEIEINDKNIIDYLPKVNYFIVKNNGIIIKNGFSIRQLQCFFCCNKSNKSSSNINYKSGNSEEAACNVNDKRIQIIHSFSSLHYWYPDWPDHRSPSDISVLLEISQHMLTWDNSKDQPLPVIHCSAGIGRTGCMAAILNAICQIRASFPLKTINAYQKAEQTTSPTTTAAIGSFYDSDNIESSMNDVDNLQSFSSQSFPYSNNSSSNKIKTSNLNITKIIQSPAESNIDKNKIQSIGKARDGMSSNLNSYPCSTSKVQTKNNIYCEKAVAPTVSAPIRKSPSIHVDILGIVCNLRLQRGGMVQNSEQYELIHRAMCLYLKRVLKIIYEAQI